MDEDIEEGSVVITNIYGDVCVRKKARRKRQKALVQDMFYDYATNTTLHGLSYTTKRGLTIIEKIFWLITFLASICLCTYLINNVWIKWKTSPVIVTVSEKLVPVRTVPFPSVLICPQSKTKATVYNFTAEKLRLYNFLMQPRTDSGNTTSTEMEFAKFQDVANVCGGFYGYPEHLKFLNRMYSDETVARSIYEVAPKKDDIFEDCVFWGKYDFGCAAISETLTSEGLCFSINTLAAQDILRNSSINNSIPYLSANKSAVNWTDEHGYTDFGPHVYPVPGKENRASPDIQIIMKTSLIDRDLMCNTVNSGYKVFIQHPADLPQSSVYYFAVLNKQVSSMALSFSVLNTSESLIKYDPEIRQCYFPGERYLKYFKIYTANNCKIECLANVTFNLCNCVAFYMPHESKTICTELSQGCMNLARDKMVEIEATDPNRTCRCLPSCNSVDYEAEILKTDYNLKDLLQVVYNVRNLTVDDDTQYSKLEMYFKRSRFVSMHRSELFGLTDFLANIGGLLGLFLGFSFLSLVELFYFLTLRLWCTLKKDLKQEKLERQNTIVRKF
ncbi:unnamed protein product [Arctia plantaginis]|uniref:Uncharacterized protein n=1 Tax=Arctia plantaginis TaxID=874455 RepID=A0A8S1A0F5_ARCPL|nr:unnamed protein product [Arctia plantaginis]